MFLEMGYRDPAALDSMTAAFRPWLQSKMTSREYLAWVAVDPPDRIVAGLGLWLMDWPPHLIGPGAPRGNILNVYTAPSHRRQGIARRLMDASRLVPPKRNRSRNPPRQRPRPLSLRTLGLHPHQRDALTAIRKRGLTTLSQGPRHLHSAEPTPADRAVCHLFKQPRHFLAPRATSTRINNSPPPR